MCFQQFPPKKFSVGKQLGLDAIRKHAVVISKDFLGSVVIENVPVYFVPLVQLDDLFTLINILK